MAVQLNADTSDMQRLMARLGQEGRRAVEIAMQEAVRKTGHLVIAAERREMRRVFDRPTRFTLNAFEISFPRAGGQIGARVQPKDGYWSRSDNYLQVQIEGGQRRTKAFERALKARGLLPDGWFAVPGAKASIDAYGNMSAGQIRQVLAWFTAAESGLAGSIQNMTAATRQRRRRGTRKRAGFEYFAVVPGVNFVRGRRQTLHPGIYRRTTTGAGARSIDPILIFVRRMRYSRRFDFYGIGNKIVRDNYTRLFNTRYQREMDKIR